MPQWNLTIIHGFFFFVDTTYNHFINFLGNVFKSFKYSQTLLLRMRIFSHWVRNFVFCDKSSHFSQILLIMRKRVPRSLLKSSMVTSCKPYFQKHELLTLYIVYILECAFYDMKNFSKFARVVESTHYSIQSSSELYVPFAHLSQIQSCPYITPAIGHNCLPSEVTFAPS